MGRDHLQMSLISDSESEAVVPGGETRRERRRLVMDPIVERMVCGSSAAVGLRSEPAPKEEVTVAGDADGGSDVSALTLLVSLAMVLFALVAASSLDEFCCCCCCCSAGGVEDSDSVGASFVFPSTRLLLLLLKVEAAEEDVSFSFPFPFPFPLPSAADVDVVAFVPSISPLTSIRTG